MACDTKFFFFYCGGNKLQISPSEIYFCNGFSEYTWLGANNVCCGNGGTKCSVIEFKVTLSSSNTYVHVDIISSFKTFNCRRISFVPVHGMSNNCLPVSARPSTLPYLAVLVVGVCKLCNFVFCENVWQRFLMYFEPCVMSSM